MGNFDGVSRLLRSLPGPHTVQKDIWSDDSWSKFRKLWRSMEHCSSLLLCALSTKPSKEIVILILWSANEGVVVRGTYASANKIAPCPIIGTMLANPIGWMWGTAMRTFSSFWVSDCKGTRPPINQPLTCVIVHRTALQWEDTADCGRNIAAAPRSVSTSGGPLSLKWTAQGATNRLRSIMQTLRIHLGQKQLAA